MVQIKCLSNERSGMLALSTIFWLSCHHNCLDAAEHIDSYSSQAVQTQTLISLQALTHLRFLSTCSWCQHIILLGLKPKPVQRRNIICKADGCQNMWDQSQCFWGWPCQIPKAQRTESSGLKGLKIGALNDKIWDIFWITRVYRCGLRPLDPSVDIVLCLLPSGDQAARYMMFEG